MILKPSDLFLGLVDFLAFIVPGFFLCATLPEIADFNVPEFLSLTSEKTTAFAWFSFIMISYISGHFIHHICAMTLNPIYEFAYQKSKINKHETFILRTEEVIGEKLPLMTDKLSAAEAFLNVNYPTITPHLEKCLATSKLFRSLCLLSLYLCFYPCLSWTTIILLIIISILCFTRFANQRWKYRFSVYQYFLLAIDK